MMKIMTRLSMKSMPNRYTRREAVFSGRRCALRATSPTALAVGAHGSNLIRGPVFSHPCCSSDSPIPHGLCVIRPPSLLSALISQAPLNQGKLG